MDILFKNEYFVAVDKPGGWLSVPSRMGKDDQRPCLGHELERRLGARLWPVHRLDREVTGLILYALIPEAHRAANSWFEQRFVHKTYEALTEGKTSPCAGHEFLWESTLLRGKKRSYESPYGKPSETRARVLGVVELADGPAYHWELEPLTGRPHQLRFELARHGYPVLGDRLYGAARPYRPDEIALRCQRLDFTDCPGASEFDLPPTLAAPPLLPSATQLEESQPS